MIGRLVKSAVRFSSPSLRGAPLARGYHQKITNRFDDVVRLRYSTHGTPVAIINDKLMAFDDSKILLELRNEIMDANAKIHSIELVSRDGYPYHETTPLRFITEDSFCVVINNTDYYMVLKFGDEDIFDNDSQPVEDLKIQSMLTNFGSTAGKSAILSNFVDHIIEEVVKNKTAGNKINGYTLRNIIENKIQKDSLTIKFEMETINQLLAVLNEKKAVMIEIKSSVETLFREKSKRRLKFLYGIMLAQMAFTQYGTYVKYSWDIMEPICCLFGIFDSILAYSFWIANNSDYSLERFENKYIEAKLNRYFSKDMNVSEQLEDIERMINHLELWRSLHSDSLPEILEALDSKFAEETDGKIQISK